MTKPFGVQELFARIDAVMRRSEVSATAKTVCEDQLIRLDPSTREAHAANQKLKLSPKEFDLLMYLFKNKERVVPRDELLSRVWNYRVDLNLNSRTVHARNAASSETAEGSGTDAAVIVAVAKIGTDTSSGQRALNACHLSRPSPARHLSRPSAARHLSRKTAKDLNTTDSLSAQGRLRRRRIPAYVQDCAQGFLAVSRLGMTATGRFALESPPTHEWTVCALLCCCPTGPFGVCR